MSGERAPNRLVHETSPYLLQHAYNPVDWYPWGEEALGRARSLDRPILLSIGYAACHWCHVMERESFEDSEVAELMNEHFVPVKVDREERPDLDAIYMDAVQAMTGHGGWPMTVFLTPDGIPFFGGTYFPAEDRLGMPSFRRVLASVEQAWRERRGEVDAEGRRLFEAVMAQTTPRPSAEPLEAGLIDAAGRAIGASYDETYGGFGRAPKFPQPPVLEFMLRVAARQGVPVLGAQPPAGPLRDVEALAMVEHTLERMALGGIYDQLGGGFARYSVDRAWLVPHFEKMLYDNAQLSRVFTHAWQVSRRPLFARIAAETLDYLLSDMRAPEGGFYSSEDADSEGEEGRFYVWSHGEVLAVAPEAASYYRVTEQGNFEGSNILTAAGPDPPLEARARLLEARSARVRPGRDEKVLTSWNGLAVAALAESGRALGRPDFVDAAAKAAELLLGACRDEAGRLMHSYKDGRAKVLGLLEDHAYLADGLLSLWEATFEPAWFEECDRLVTEMLDRFWDPEDGGFFTTASDHERLVARRKEIVESVTPSPNAAAILVLLKMAILTGRSDLERKAVEGLRLARPYLERFPQAASTFLAALDFHLSTPKEIVIVGDRSHPSAGALLGEVWGRFLPNRVVAAAPPGIPSPLLEGKRPLDGTPTAFVCEHYVCRAPTTDPAELARQLG